MDKQVSRRKEKDGKPIKFFRGGKAKGESCFGLIQSLNGRGQSCHSQLEFGHEIPEKWQKLLIRPF